MNIFPGTANTPGPGNTAGTGQQAPQTQQQRTAGPGAAQPASPPQDAARQAAATRPVLDASETALTRRDLPRGSLVNIVA